ncbi:MAG TPA: hypothetical protein VHD15_01195, partial [Hyphomicrobiales bacterium]|nr:hypothetical protein [Hyphomicrobiales bacterium]
MRPKAKVRDSLPSDSATPARQRGRGVGPSGSRRHLEARFAPLGPARADDGEAAPPRPARPAMLPPINVTLLLRSAGLVVVVAAVLLALRPVSKIVRTSAPAPDLARIRVISSAGDSSAAAPARPKRQARLPQVAETPAPAPARTAVAAPPP